MKKTSSSALKVRNQSKAPKSVAGSKASAKARATVRGIGKEPIRSVQNAGARTAPAASGAGKAPLAGGAVKASGAGAAKAPAAGGAKAPVAGGAKAPVAGGAKAPVAGGAKAPVAGGAKAPVAGGAKAPLARMESKPQHSAQKSRTTEIAKAMGKAPAKLPERVMKPIQKLPIKQMAKPVTSAKKRSASGSLTSSQIRELEARLKGLAEELRLAIELKASLFNANSFGESLIKGDDAEVAEKQRTNNAALQEIDILKHRLTLVRRACAKIEAGVFGLCEETEEPIGYERLNIVPWARYSIHVQEIRERKLRDFRGNKLQAEA